MRILISLFVILFSFSTIANEFNWKKIATNSSGTVFYIDESTIKKLDNQVVFLSLSDYFKPTENGRLSSIIYKEVNCINLDYRYLKDFYFDLPMGKGEPTNIIDDISEWKKSKKGSTAEYIHKAVCD